MAHDLTFGLGVHGQNKLGCSRLPSLVLLFQVLPSFDVGGVCGMFGWQVWLGSRRFGGFGIRVGTGIGVCRWVVGVVVVLSSSLPLPLSLLL